MIQKKTVMANLLKPVMDMNQQKEADSGPVTGTNTGVNWFRNMK